MSRLEIEGEVLRIATALLSGDGDFGDDNALASLDALDCADAARPGCSLGGSRRTE